MNLFDFTLSELKEWMSERGHKPFMANQVFDWVYKKLNFNPSEWSNLSKACRLELENIEGLLALPAIVWSGTSQKDGTRKFLLKLHDQKTIEAVLIPAKDRLTLCLSSQVGCAIGCKFCHTATQGFTRHLKTSEVVGQYLLLLKEIKKLEQDDNAQITNIVYMGMGEPLHNFNNMKKASDIFLEPKGLAIGQRRITLSTSGLVPQIEKLNDFPPVNIAISLHAAHDNVRSELMPINKVYDLKRLIEAIEKIPLKAHRYITYEYILIDGLNNGSEDISALVKLLAPKKSKINIIPFNEYPGSDFKRPSVDNINWFKNELLKRGLVTTVRVTKGDDILAACGQLKTFLESAKKEANLVGQMTVGQLNLPITPVLPTEKSTTL